MASLASAQASYGCLWPTRSAIFIGRSPDGVFDAHGTGMGALVKPDVLNFDDIARNIGLYRHGREHKFA